jgi:hypothetical protein
MLQVTWPSAIHSAGLPKGYLSVDRFRCGAISDDSAAEGSTQIFNLLWIGTVGSYCASWVRSLGIAHDYFLQPKLPANHCHFNACWEHSNQREVSSDRLFFGLTRAE